MKNYGTYNEKPITEEMLESFSANFERDWQPEEITVVPTERGKALLALQALDLPVSEIEALERRAKYENKPLSFYLRTVLQNVLAG
jgi:DNA-binding PadR family transcriptional regulator